MLLQSGAMPVLECPPLDDTNFPEMGTIPDEVMTNLQKKQHEIKKLFDNLDELLDQSNLSHHDLDPVFNYLSTETQVD